MLQQAEELLVNFMESKTGYASASGDIVGILKSMNDEMTADLKDATDSENEAMASFDELVAAKAKEIDALIASIESKTTRSRRRSCIHRMIKLGLSNPVPVEQIQQVRVPVPNPIPVPTPVVQTQQVPVPTPVPVTRDVRVPVPVPQHVPVPNPVLVTQVQRVPVPVPVERVVHRPVPVPTPVSVPTPAGAVLGGAYGGAVSGGGLDAGIGAYGGGVIDAGFGGYGGMYR